VQYCVDNIEHLKRQSDAILRAINDLSDEHTRGSARVQFDLSLTRGFPLDSKDEMEKIEASLLIGPEEIQWQALVRKIHPKLLLTRLNIF